MKKDLPFGLLTWKTTSLLTTADFLDLTISINNEGNITTKTYQTFSSSREPEVKILNFDCRHPASTLPR